jgi:hypothetical protein
LLGVFPIPGVRASSSFGVVLPTQTLRHAAMATVVVAAGVGACPPTIQGSVPAILVGTCSGGSEGETGYSYVRDV